MKIKGRLKKIIEYIPVGSRVADIGTDHGLIPVYLVESGIAGFVIASDLNKGSLEKAIKKVEKRNLQSHIETRLGDGLKVLSLKEVDVIIIAGMGGILIAKILEEGKNIAKTVKRLVLQPMRDSDYLRKYLIENGYKICDEDLVKENQKYYEIIIAEQGRQKVKKDIYYEIGERLIEKNHPLLKEFLQHKINKLTKILNKLSEMNEKRKKLEKKIKEFEVLLNGLEMPSNSFYNG
ncbi:MAG TPA: SAM-dependent methyltransferase [Clostridia bacterium]|nr:SAM-dependent methyltransferase [Clostridia bacterium]